MYHHTRISCNTCRRNKRSIVKKNQIPFRALILFPSRSSIQTVSEGNCLCLLPGLILELCILNFSSYLLSLGRDLKLLLGAGQGIRPAFLFKIFWKFYSRSKDTCLVQWRFSSFSGSPLILLDLLLSLSVE